MDGFGHLPRKGDIVHLGDDPTEWEYIGVQDDGYRLFRTETGQYGWPKFISTVVPVGSLPIRFLRRAPEPPRVAVGQVRVRVLSAQEAQEWQELVVSEPVNDDDRTSERGSP